MIPSNVEYDPSSFVETKGSPMTAITPTAEGGSVTSWEIHPTLPTGLSIDSSTGTLTFENAPDYESPSDSNKDNSYIVDIRASDSDNNITEQTVTVLIADVDELTSSPKYSIFTDINNVFLFIICTTCNVRIYFRIFKYNL